MGLGAYAFAGAMEGLGMSLVKLGEDKKAAAERKRQEERDDRLRAEDRADRREYRAEGWARDDAVRNEGREYEQEQRGLGARADTAVYRSVYGDGGFEAKPGTLGELLLTTESGGGFDTLFGYSERDGGRFAGTRVSQMTIGELKEFSDPSGEYGQHVKGKVGRVATPMGAGQIIGTTLRETAKALGLSDDTVFSPEVQMQMVDYLASQALAGATTPQQKRQALRGVWEGFKHVSDSKLDAAIAAYESGDIGVTFSSPNDDVYASLEDPYTSAGARTVGVSELERRRRGDQPSKLTGEEWIPGDKPGTEILVGYDERGNAVPRKRDGKPITRATNQNNKQKSLSASMMSRIDDWADANTVDDKVKRAFALEVERLVNEEGMTETKAWDTALNTANKSRDVVTTEDRFILPDRETVTPGSYDGTFGRPRGLGAPDDPNLPSDPDSGMPKVGQVIDGYRFMGGDPSDQKNWKKV